MDVLQTNELLADIRNKLGPIGNLIAILKQIDFSTIIDPDLDRLIKEEIKQSEINLQHIKEIGEKTDRSELLEQFDLTQKEIDFVINKYNNRTYNIVSMMRFSNNSEIITIDIGDKISIKNMNLSPFIYAKRRRFSIQFDVFINNEIKPLKFVLTRWYSYGNYAGEDFGGFVGVKKILHNFLMENWKTSDMILY